MPISVDRANRVRRAAADALARLGSVPVSIDDAFAPLGETLTWLCAADEMFERDEPSYAGNRELDSIGRTLRGLRYARNQTVHGTTVTSVATRVQGASFPMSFPVSFSTRLIWTPQSDLPPVPQPRPAQEAAYANYLASRDVVPSLHAAVAYLATI